ncbi:P-loop containing nucleoside triphosphate hydrolase protein [Schizophyllum amplum]|uniref:P-loop containing nucleoside triphosphate hydrolase protein n=1 Tax=Schizophyllum amplum TaxID=97359 RepID=A0A550CBI2_9AGAR|nr:P-loop containing nucleoside triphosphate hydrolase protein [Auriculariopsis ampla]
MSLLFSHAGKLLASCKPRLTPPTGVSSDARKASFAIGTVWPSQELSPDSAISPGRHPSGLPSLRDAIDVKAIKLKELALHLVDLRIVTSKQVLEVAYEGRPRRFVVQSMSDGARAGDPVDNLAKSLENVSIDSAVRLGYISWDTTVSIEPPEPRSPLPRSPATEALPAAPDQSAYSSVGGLAKQITEIRDLLEIPLSRPDLFRDFGLKPPRGLLLHGPPGTGKTHLARAIAAAARAAVVVVNGPELSSAYHGETEGRLRAVFEDAAARSPCIVVLDEVDALVPRREDGGGEVEARVVATLLTLLDGVQADDASRVVVVATTNRPNAIDPALRRPGRFDREIEIGVPDVDARADILRILLAKTPHQISSEEIYALAARAHGYVGADLSSVVREAGTAAIKRYLSAATAASEPLLTVDDLSRALLAVRPSAMRSLFVEAPRVRYADIGGQDTVIERLREAVEWPLKHPEAFQRLGVRPPKGVLLYGPPGCSKTVLARACACESGLLNKFVGESERAVREIFRKARAAAPAIVFFDEIDALATSRDADAHSHEGVLTSLLNEMDGVQELLGVTIIGATNRPEVLDSALMRPGRLDRLLYVGPPNQEGREAVLKIKTAGMRTDPDLRIDDIARLEAALLTMKKDLNAEYVPHEAFVKAAGSTKRQITPAVIQKYVRWRETSGVKDS